MAKSEDREESLEMEALQSSPQGFTGTVNLQLTDLFQMVCLCRSDLVVRVRSGESIGAIYVKNGQVCHAQTELVQGETAFFEMFQWKDGQFEMLPYQEPGTSSIAKPWEHLLLEAMRLKDEGNNGSSSGVVTEGQDQSSREDTGELEMEQNIDLVFDELEEISRDIPFLEEAFELPDDAAKPVRVLVVDDSMFFARQLKRMMEAESGIEVVSIAKNGKEALEYLANDQQIDLITLDVQMPVMQGDTTLKHIMIRYPIPVLIISAFESQSVQKVFEFLQLGAIDFFSKPAANEDIARYGDSLRSLVTSVAKADVSRFRRWRKPKSILDSAMKSDSAEKSLLVMLGAEGAYMDWFRLPLYNLSRQGLVIGLQKLPDPFLTGFCRLIEDWTRARTEPINYSGWFNSGSFNFGNASSQVDLELEPKSMSVNVKCTPEKNLPWHEGVHLWLEQLAEQAKGRLSVYAFSASYSLPPTLIEKLLMRGARFIMSPRETAMCAELVDSIYAYSQSYPQQISWASHESFMEVWMNNEAEMRF